MFTRMECFKLINSEIIKGQKVIRRSNTKIIIKAFVKIVLIE